MKKKSKKVHKSSKIKKTLMAIAIAFVLVFFVGYGLNTFYKEPKWEDFCGESRERKIGIYDTKDSCETAGGKWEDIERGPIAVKLETNQYLCTRSPSIKGEEFVFNCNTAEDLEKENGWCDPDYACREKYDAAKEPHNRISFIILLIIGIIVIVISTVAMKENAVSVGVLAGGILTIIYGTIRFWGSITDIARFSILGIALAVLITVAYRKLK